MIKKRVVYIVTIVLAVVYIILGNRIVTKRSNTVGSSEETLVNAKVTKILSVKEEISEAGSSEEDKDITVEFEAKLTGGKEKGKVVTLCQEIKYPNTENGVKLKVGDRILALEVGQNEEGTIWKYVDRERMTAVIILGIIFFALLILFGRWKGVNTILALCFIVLSIFMVFIPSILAGFNIYFMSILTCVYIVVTTIIIVYGIDEKSIATALGCFGGVTVSLILLAIMDSIIHLSGYTSEESMFLVLLDLDNPINLKAIIFASVIIGAIGAIMDISIDISSSLREISYKVQNPTFSEIFKSGITIGRDIIATMSNTLVLAYTGSCLSGVVLTAAYNTSLINLFNKEAIIIEILQALIGSLGLLFTIPLTSIICGIMYSHRGMKAEIKDITESIKKKFSKRLSKFN